MAISILDTVDDANFDTKVLTSALPVLVLFTAAWSGPSKTLEANVMQLASDYEDKLSIYKCDVDANLGTPQKYSVSSIPVSLIFKGGQVTSKKVGNIAKDELKTLMDSALK